MNEMKNKLYLVRHGENPANVLGQLSSRIIDFPLNERGRLQASQTAEYFRSITIHEIYSSPLKRAYETAQIIAAPHGLQVAPLENFREIFTGKCEEEDAASEASWGIWFQVNQAWLAGNLETRFPGGENYYEVRDRMRAGLEQVLAGKDGRSILIVAHIGILTATISDLCPAVDIHQIVKKETQNCAITEVEMQQVDGRWQGELVRWSDFSHLHGEAAKFTPGLKRVTGT
jgi:broad specificity phosphatase PhoE